MKMRTQTLQFFVALFFAATLSVPSVHATTYTVQDTGDGAANAANCPGSGCRLRDALAKVVDGDMIDFSVTTPATITLNSGQLEVSKSIMINGPGANLLTVDANHNSRVFYIDSGITVTIDRLTIMNGTIDSGGGGIYNNQATLTVTYSTLSGNSATGTFFSSGIGGGIYNDHATLTVINSTLSGNSASSVFGSVGSTGGGIFNAANNRFEGDTGSSTVTVSNSTLSGNSAHFGGGIDSVATNGSSTNTHAILTITNSTFSGNSAVVGGGIANVHTGNTGDATLTIGSTVLNAGASGANISNSGGTVTSLGYNLSSDDGGGFLTGRGDQINTAPMLGPLADNGGPTFTHALLTGSPAIDQGKNFSGSTTDQRGFFRTFDNFSIPNAPGGDGTDIGAFEVQATVCPQGQGFWKNHPNAWPVSSLMLGSQTYTKTELLAILQTPIKGDASLILAHQLIAAKLNIANANGTPVASTTADADSLLSGFNGKLPYHVKPSTSTGQAMVNDANVLDSYNNGVMTPGCGL